LLRQKSNKKGEPAAPLFCFCFFVAAISADYRAASTISLSPSFEILLTA
jgi:hypothetical protein